MKKKNNNIDLLNFTNNLCYIFNKKIKMKKVIFNKQFLSIFKKLFLLNIYIDEYYDDFFLAKYNVLKTFWCHIYIYIYTYLYKIQNTNKKFI